MNKTETILVMKIISDTYPMFYKDQASVDSAIATWGSILKDDDFKLIQKGLKRFIRQDAKGYPPVPGQIIALAADIRKEEWEQRKREQDALPEPEIKIAPMPEETKARLREMGWNG